MAACPDEAHQFFDYLAASSAGQVRGGRDLQIMFGVGGEHDLTERDAAASRGLAGSRPVRVGNGAWNQRQIDVYGELLGCGPPARRPSSTRTIPAPPPGGSSSSRCADAAARRWREKDQGIWEVRGEPRHFLYSKLMCWVALDRAVALADTLRAADRVPGWRAAAEEIRDAILAEGWSDTAKSFTQSFGSDDLDASNLMIAIVGFLPADDPRVVATIEAVAERLTDSRGLVYRYRTAAGERRRPRRRGGHVPALHVLAGPGAGRGRAGRPGPGRCSNGPSATSTTSACWPRRSTRPPATCWATSRRRSATSDSSTPPGPSLKRGSCANRVVTCAAAAPWARDPRCRRAGAARHEVAAARGAGPGAPARARGAPATDRVPAHRARRPSGMGQDLIGDEW